ncbi:MAG TPA: type II toxin-antitoxin system RelE/ParE family toxin [Methylomirabilota bacterium]|nr:type II toxin-antitoxin system RelE/ParE family toxin [Methylomirabilota bacterium]
MKIEILDEAQQDLIEGFHFYENREIGLGSYFLDGLFSDIDSLVLFAGIHQLVYGYYRCLSKRFPFAIYYDVEGELARVHAVLDCRRNPAWTRKRLTGRS